MPLDGLALGAVAQELHTTLLHGRVDRIQQPEPDEIHIIIRAQGANHRLLLSCSANFARVHLTKQSKKSPDTPPMFCMLLRKYIGSGRVLAVRQIASDRVLHIDFEALDELGDVTKRTLIAEIMGRHSNLILIDAQGKILSCARNITSDISRVREVLPGLTYETPPAQDKLDPTTALPSELAERIQRSSGGTLAKALLHSLSGLSQQAAYEIAYRIAGDQDVSSAKIDPLLCAQEVLKILSQLPNTGSPTLYFDTEGTPLDTTSFTYDSRPKAQQQTRASMSLALDEFYITRDHLERMKQRSASLRQLLKNALERCEKKLAIQLETLHQTHDMDQLRIRGDLIMASMHQIPRGATSVMVTDYFSEELSQIEVLLDPSLAPMDNAQRAYKQYGKLKAASRLVQGQIQANQEEISYLQSQLHYLDACTSLEEMSEIRQELIAEGYQRATTADKKKKGASPTSKPHLYLSSDGIEIYIGKNNAQNDRLTQYADGNDTWMHVKDMPGSHVIVRTENPSNQCLLEASQLAAYHSKAQQSGLVPVDITLRKYVKKPAGAKPGFVIYAHQRTVYVTPSNDLAKGEA